MLKRISLDALIATVAAVVVLFPAGSAYADNSGHGGSNSIWGNVDCGQNPYPGCQLGAGSHSTRSGSRSGGHTGTQTGAGGSSGRSGPDPFSCVDDLVPYAPAHGALRPPAGQKASEGGWYVSVCAGDRAGTPGGGVYYPPVWVVNGPNPRPAVTPAELARSAYNKLPLTAPTIVLSPAGQQLVNLPTWLAITGWGVKTATAGVPKTAVTPGVSVTATATPTSVVWSTGDGATVTCGGPGTVFGPGDDPAAASPTCGHTYRVSSAGQPGAAFTLTATVHWSVTWSGAGRAGTFPDLTTTATARVPVAESEALTTR
jgi:hypothetical protein